MPSQPLLIGGTANPRLVRALADELGLEPARASFDRFPDGETLVTLEQPVHRRDVLLVQPTSPPVNDHLVELLVMADACRRASAASITAVVPYFGYARQDRRAGGLEPITARMVATLLEAVGVDRLVTLDPHTAQLEGFFHIPVSAASASAVLCEALRTLLPDDAVVVSPDAGRVDLAERYARALERRLVILHKERTGGRTTRVTRRLGDVEGSTCVVVDDMISTGGTLVQTAATLREAGAGGLIACATHGLLLGDATRRLREAGFSRVLVTDSVAAPESDPLVQVVPVAPLLARAVLDAEGGG